MLYWLISTDAAIFGLTLGILLIYLELNRPGLVVPGSVGLLIVLLCTAVIAHQHPSGEAIFYILLASALLVLQLFLPLPRFMPLLSALLLIRGFYHLPARGPLHLVNAFCCGATLSFGTSYLAGIARRARASKRLD